MWENFLTDHVYLNMGELWNVVFGVVLGFIPAYIFWKKEREQFFIDSDFIHIMSEWKFGAGENIENIKDTPIKEVSFIWKQCGETDYIGAELKKDGDRIIQRIKRFKTRTEARRFLCKHDSNPDSWEIYRDSSFLYNPHLEHILSLLKK